MVVEEPPTLERIKPSPEGTELSDFGEFSIGEFVYRREFH